jgi:hypothetical protein
MESDIITPKITSCIILLITLLSTLSGCIQDNKNQQLPIDKNAIYVGSTNANYTSIQQAINAANNNATIYVRSGVYNELIDMNKTITLIGEDKNTTILNFNPSFSITQVPILNINADNCTIKNIQITLSNKTIIAQGITINSKNNIIQNTIIKPYQWN